MRQEGGGGASQSMGTGRLVVSEFFYIKNNVCEVFDGIEGDAIHEACIILVETTKGTIWGKCWCTVLYGFGSCPCVCRV